jgi:HNH endonuclease
MPLSGDAQPYPKDAATQPGRPRRYRRKVAGRKGWEALRAELAPGWCAVCGMGFVSWPPFEAHHLVPRSMGGDDVIDNIVALHRSCHKLVTENEPVSLAALAASLSDSRYAYCVSKLGETAMQRLFGVER